MKTMFQKIWEQHEVVPETAQTPAVLYVDRHLIHEVTTPQAFTVLRQRGLRLHRPDLTFATIDHSSPTRTEQIFGGRPPAPPGEVWGGPPFRRGGAPHADRAPGKKGVVLCGARFDGDRDTAEDLLG